MRRNYYIVRLRARRIKSDVTARHGFKQCYVDCPLGNRNKEMDLRKSFIFFCFTLLLLSCKSKTDKDLFEEFVHKKSVDNFIVLQTAEITPVESLDKNYRKIIQNKGNFSFLLGKAKSTQKTEYCIPNLVCPLTEGDVAICMLIDMYKMSDEYFGTVMYENIKRETNSARDFWDYVQSSDESRNEIIQKISDWILLYESNELLVSWTENEILNHSFELISDNEIENFSFSTTDDGIHISSCTYGKKIQL